MNRGGVKMEIVKYSSPNINKGRNGYIPDLIVCHITEGSYSGAVSWLTNPSSGVSAHFVVAKDGRVVQLVDIEDTAWANGTTNNPGDSRYYKNSQLEAVRKRIASANFYTISIEHEGIQSETQGRLTREQLEADVELIKHIRAEVKRIYDKEIPVDREHIVGHGHVVPKWKPNCPGLKFPYDEIISRINQSDNGKEEDMKRYNSIDEIPEYAIETIQNLIKARYLKGDGNVLDLSEDMIRLFVILDRAALFDK